MKRAIVGILSNADVPVIRALAEAAEAFGDPAGWDPEMREAMEALLAPVSSAARVPFVRSPSRCTCGTLIPCDAHETDDDRREAMREIREKMTADLRSLGADKVIACDSFCAPGARVLPKFDPPETVKRVIDGAVGTRSGR